IDQVAQDATQGHAEHGIEPERSALPGAVEVADKAEGQHRDDQKEERPSLEEAEGGTVVLRIPELDEIANHVDPAADGDRGRYGRLRCLVGKQDQQRGTTQDRRFNPDPPSRRLAAHVPDGTRCVRAQARATARRRCPSSRSTSSVRSAPSSSASGAISRATARVSAASQSRCAASWLIGPASPEIVTLIRSLTSNPAVR